MLLHVHERRPVSDLLDGVFQSRHHGLSITEQHHRFVHVNKSLSTPALTESERDDHPRFVLGGVNDGFLPADIRLFAAGAGVVGADDNGDIALESGLISSIS